MDRFSTRPETLFDKRWLFVTGLAAYLGGQVLINMGRDFVDSLRPIDFAHWLLIVGVLLMIPYAANLPRTRVNLVASPVLVIGIAGIVGMCVIDLIIWSYPPAGGRTDFLRHLMDAPTIWTPFMTIGPWLFGIGLAMASVSFLRSAPWGVLAVILGSTVSALTEGWYTVAAYALILVGYVICFRMTRQQPPGADARR